MDPYTIDNNGRRINTFNVNNGGSLLRLTGASLNLSYSLNNETFKKKTDKDKNAEEEASDQYRAASGGRTDDLMGFGFDSSFNQREQRNNEDENEEALPYNSKLPWDLRLAFATRYTNTNRQNEFSTASLMFSGNIDLTTKWSMRFSSGYDF